MQPPDSPPRQPMPPPPIQVSQPPTLSPSKIPQEFPSFSVQSPQEPRSPPCTELPQGSPRSSSQMPQGSPRSGSQMPQGSPRTGAQMREMSSPSAPPPPHPNEGVRSPGDVPVSYPPPPNLTPTNVNQVTTTVKWSTGLCECHSDIPNCCITFFCPCITFGQITEIVDKGISSCAINGTIYALLAVILGCACFYSVIYRRRMRRQFNLKGSDLGDCCIHSCCEICALSQEYRELQLRGFDLGLGWHANIDRQNQAAVTIPPPHESMRR